MIEFFLEGQALSVDVTMLNLARFDEGHPIQENQIV
jgi:hypothetical protein